jgi:hypothetical protein
MPRERFNPAMESLREIKVPCEWYWQGVGSPKLKWVVIAGRKSATWVSFSPAVPGWWGDYSAAFSSLEYQTGTEMAP